MFVLEISNINIGIYSDLPTNDNYLSFVGKILCCEKNDLVIKKVKHIEFINSYLPYKERIHFCSEKNFLSLVFILEHNNIPTAKLTFHNDYRSATIETSLDYNTKIDGILDSFVFTFFQVQLLFNSGINLHASAISWKGRAIVFTAPSGTGKTTQAKLWETYCNAKTFNGDRPAITIKEGECLVHGTPWSGTDPVYENISFPLAVIVLLEQSKTNKLVKLSPVEALPLMLPRVFMPYFSEELTAIALDIVGKIIETVPIYKLLCQPNKESVELLKEQLSLLYD